MNIYTIYADHTDTVTSLEFVTLMRKFLDKMVEIKRMECYRITRMKLGFRSMDLPEFRIDMEFTSMQQLDDAMSSIIENEHNIEHEHVGFNHLVDVETIQHFLYRDYPDE
jgi:hypothetical protein